MRLNQLVKFRAYTEKNPYLLLDKNKFGKIRKEQSSEYAKLQISPKRINKLWNLPQGSKSTPPTLFLPKRFLF